MAKHRCIPVLGSLVALCAACSDEVPRIPDSELYMREFVKEFGTFSNAQDWNMATSGSVTVSCSAPSRVQISARINGKNYLLADYQDVSNPRELRFDIPKGIKEVTVHCGGEAVTAPLGGKVGFDGNGRAYFESTNNSDYGPITVEVADESYWRTIPAVDVMTYDRVMPEKEVNVFNEGVDLDFVFRSTGDIIIYPVYWNTSAINTLGIAYKDKKGEMQHIPLYSNYHDSNYTEGVNLASYAMYAAEDVLTYNFVKTIDDTVWPHVKTTIFDDEDVRNYVGDALINGKSFSDLNGKEDFKALINYIGRKGMMKIFDTKGIEYESIVEIAGVVPLHANFMNEEDGCSGWYNSETPVKYIRKGAKYAPDSRKGNEGNNALIVSKKAEFCVFTKGLRVHVPEGMRYGMYIESSSYSDTKFYSIADNNTDKRVVRDPETGVPVKGPDGQIQYMEDGAYHAATWIGPIYGWRWLSFEDCKTSDESGMNVDINDMVFLIENATDDTPDIEVEKPDEPVGEPIKWLIACEDLGAKDDFDFNDVVFEVEYVAGTGKATITPLAAGGTLQAYLMRNDEELTGEWHGLFGGAPHTQMINTTTHSVDAASFDITVPEDFSISSPNGIENYRQNMGGFHIRVEREDGSETMVTPPGAGMAPQMILVFQQAGKPWRWPLERHNIKWGYTRFETWMQGSSFELKLDGTDWFDVDETDSGVKTHTVVRRK